MANSQMNVLSEEAMAFPLHLAVRKRHLQNITKALLEDRTKVNQPNSFGDTPLMLAIIGGPYGRLADVKRKHPTPEETNWWSRGPETVKILLEHGASLEERDPEGKTALHMAAKGESTDVVDVLVQAGADIHAQDIDGRTPLHLSCRNTGFGNQVTKYLLQHGSDPYQVDRHSCTPVETAVATPHGKLCVLKAYTEHGVNLTDSRFISDNGMTLVHDLLQDAFHNYEGSDVVINRLEFLLKQGLSVNARTQSGLTPLHFAMIDGANTTIVKSLCDLNADATIVDNLGRTAVHNLSFKCESFTGDDLLADVTSMSHIKRSIYMLKDHGLDINAQDVFGATALHYAIIGLMRHQDYIRILLEHDADLLVKDNTGVCSLHLAASFLDIDTLTVVLEHCPTRSINIVDNRGASALHVNIEQNDTEAIGLLLKAGVDVFIKDYRGYTALDLAALMSYPDVVALLQTWISGAEDLGCSDYKPAISMPPLQFGSVTQNVMMDEIRNNPVLYEKINPCLAKSLRIYCSELLKSVEYGPADNNPDTTFVQEEIVNFISHLATLCGSTAPNFSFHPELRGSTREGTKCGAPNEFDILCSLEAFTDIAEINLTNVKPGFARLKLKSLVDSPVIQNMPWLVTKDGNLNFGLVAGAFYGVVKTVLEGNDIWKNTALCYSRDVHLKSTTCTFNLRWNGQICKNLLISIDLVPGIKLPGYWPDCMNREHPVPGDLSGLSCYLLCTYISEDDFQRDVEDSSYMFSYTAAELNIMLSLPHHIKLGYILAKSVKDSDFCPPIFVPDPVSGSDDGDDSDGEHNDVKDDESSNVDDVTEQKQANIIAHSGPGVSDEIEPKGCSGPSKGYEPERKKNKLDNTSNMTITYVKRGEEDHQDTDSNDSMDKDDPENIKIDREPHGEVVRANDVITSYMLKNSLLWEIHKDCQNLAKNPDSDIDGAIYWTKRIYKNLYEAVTCGRAPQFFVHSINLLDTSWKMYDKQHMYLDQWKSVAMAHTHDQFSRGKVPAVNSADVNAPIDISQRNNKNPEPFLAIINRLLGNIE